jgi:hypothetical protein
LIPRRREDQLLHDNVRSYSSGTGVHSQESALDHRTKTGQAKFAVDLRVPQHDLAVPSRTVSEGAIREVKPLQVSISRAEAAFEDTAGEVERGKSGTIGKAAVMQIEAPFHSEADYRPAGALAWIEAGWQAPGLQAEYELPQDSRFQARLRA